MRNLKRALSLALSSVMLLGMMVVGTSAASYPDVDANDNLEAIEVLEMLGVMSGDEKGNFNPDAKITRNEMAVVMTHLLNLKEGGTTPFTDVPTWAQPYVGAIYNAGVTSGTSATTYGGSANVTATEAALMVMKALGYFGYQGEFGDNWSVAVVKKATQIDLFNGVSATVSSQITRSEAAQICLNALKADVTVVTQTGGANIETGDTSVNITPTYTYEAVKNSKTNDYRTESDAKDDVQQLVEKLYAGLTMDDGASVKDDAGRPASTWSYKGETVTAAKTADAVYTAAVTQKDLAKAMGITTTSAPKNGVVYNVKSADQAALKFTTLNPNSTDKVGGNGVVIEAFKDEGIIVVTATYAGKVTAVDTKSDDRTITVNGLEYKTEAFAKDDMVLYTVNAANDKLLTVAAATKAASGEVTRAVTTGSNKSITVDGTEYKAGALFNVDKDVEVTGKYDVYVDAYGYVVCVDEVEAAEAQYAVVVAVKTDGSWSDEDAVKSAKVVLADGTQAEVQYKLKDGVKMDVQKDQQYLVSYTVKDGVYTFTSATAVDSNADIKEITKGNATLKTNLYADSKTVFIVRSGNKDDGYTYTSYTGIQNVPSMEDVKSTVIAENNIAKLVYVTDSNISSSSESFIFVAGSSKIAIKDGADSYFYTYNAVVDGKITTVEATVDKMDGLKNVVKYNKDGQITSATIDAKETEAKTGVTTIGEYKNNLVKLGSVYYTYNNDTAVYFIESDGTIKSSSVEALAGTSDKAETYKDVSFTLKDGVVTALFVTEA